MFHRPGDLRENSGQETQSRHDSLSIVDQESTLMSPASFYVSFRIVDFRKTKSRC